MSEVKDYKFLFNNIFKIFVLAILILLFLNMHYIIFDFSRRLGNYYYFEKGDYKKSEFTYKIAYKVNKIILKREHPLLAIILKYESDSSYMLKKYDNSIKMLKLAIEIKKKTDGLNDKEAANLFESLGTTYKAQKKYQLAQISYEQALLILGSLNDPEELIYIFNYLGKIFELQGQYDKAEKYYRKALEKKADVKNSYAIAVTLDNLGSLEEYKKNNKEALKKYQEALMIKKTTFKMRNIEVACSYLFLGLIYKKEDNLTLAKKYLNQAYFIKNKVLKEKKSKFIQSNSLYKICKE